MNLAASAPPVSDEDETRLRARVRALGFLWGPLFFVNRGPKVTAALFAERGTELVRLDKLGEPRLSARVDQRAFSHETEPARLGQAIDRIGSGDAFAGAVIDGLLRKLTPEECAKQGLAAAVMKLVLK